MKRINLLRKVQILLFNSKLYKLIGRFFYFKIIIFVIFDVLLLALIGNILNNIEFIKSILQVSNGTSTVIFFSFLLIGIRFLTLNIIFKNIAGDLTFLKARVSEKAYKSILEFGSKRYTKSEMNKRRLALVDGISIFVPGFLQPLVVITSELLVILIFIIILIIINFYFSIILFSLVSAYIVFSRYKLIASRKSGSSRAFWEGRRYSIIDSAIDGSQEIFLHNKKIDFLNQYKFISRKIAKDDQEFLFVNYSNKFLLESFLMLIIAFTTLYSSFSGIPGSELVLKSLPTLIILAVRIVPSFGKLITSFNSINFAFKPLIKLFKEIYILNNKEIYLKDKLINFPIEIPALKVNFSNKDFLNYKSFTINEAKVYRIMGISGAGKSTYIKAILNLLPYKITYSENSKKCYNSPLKDNYSNIGYVRQHPYLFSENALFNITFTDIKKNIDFKKLEKAMITTTCDQFLNINTKSISNKNFSGGQIQRIALARELYKEPQLLFLDECFSGLPLDLHKKILNNLFENYPSLTIIFISHVNLDDNVPTINHFLN